MSKTLEHLLNSEEVDCDAVLARLVSHPHEAAIEVEGDGSLLHSALISHENDNPITVDVLKAFLDAYKDAVFKVDEDGDTPLYLACRYDVSAEVVKPLLEANPEAASIRNEHGWIPLHNCRVPEIIDLLLETYPEGVGIVDRYGALPLHYAADDKEEGSLSILRSLLQAGTKVNVGGIDGGAGVLVEDNDGETPLILACKRLLSGIEFSDDEDEVYVNLRWEKVYVLARAASGALAKRNYNANIDEDGPLLHAVIESQCPQFVILRTLSDNPNQTNERDSLGRTPLAIAASQHDVSPEVIKLLLDTEHFDSRIARMPDNDGRLLLHAAAEKGWDFENRIERIVLAAPQALKTRDVQTRMYPFQLAAAEPHSNLNTVYQLLKECPEMAHGMAEGVHWLNSKLKLQEDLAEQKKEITELKRKIAKQEKEIAELQNTSYVDQRRGRKRRKLEMAELGCTVS